MTATLPLLYTHVMGSHGFPGWFWTALDKIKAGEYGQTDVRETFDDATQLAIRDQERAGIDVISDGEMRRFFFVQSFYDKMDGLEDDRAPPEDRPLRLRQRAPLPARREDRRAAGPGHRRGVPLPQDPDRQARQGHLPGAGDALHPHPDAPRRRLRQRPPGAVLGARARRQRRELKALVAAGADWIQIDEPSAAIVPGQIGEYVKMFNACVEGVTAKIGYTCASATCSPGRAASGATAGCSRTLLDCRCDQFVFEYANREMAEIDMWKEVGVDREVACGVVDVKSFYMETPEDVADRVRLCLGAIPAARLSLIPDCGFFAVPRWMAAEKLKRLAAGAALARREIGG